jgi:amino acid adenylation domain-containing protein
MNLIEKFRLIVQQFPDNNAIVTKTEVVTYAEFDQQTNKLVSYLKQNGVSTGDVVGILMDRSIDYIRVMIAITKIGAVFAPFDTKHPELRFQQMCEEANVSFIVINNIGKLPNINAVKFIALPDFSKVELAFADLILKNLVIKSDPLYIMFTSGSTGKPKGVIIPHQGVLRLVCQSNWINISSNDVFFQTSSLAFDGSTFEIWGALLNGASLVIPDVDFAFSQIEQYLLQFNISILWLTSRLFDKLIDYDVSLFKNLSVIVFGGEAASFQHVKKAFEQLPETILLNGYGPTENSTFTLAHRVTQEDLERGFIPIGEPISETECFVLNESLQIVNDGEEGVLYTSGAGLALGYTDEAITKEKFIIHPILQKRLYNIGDKVKYHNGIGYEYIGRIDRQVKIRGFRIELFEVENAIMSCNNITNAIVVFNKILMKDELAVFYTTNSQKPINENIIRKELTFKLLNHAIPTHYFFVEELPLKTTGKVDVEKLIEDRIASLKSDKSKEVNSDALKNIWLNILKISEIDEDTHFFESGGNSLDAIVLLHKIEKKMGIKLNENHLFSNPLFKDFKKNIASKFDDSFLVELKPGKQDCPIYFIPWYRGNGYFYNSIASLLKTDQAVYSFSKYIPNNIDKNDNLIKDLAKIYVEEIVRSHKFSTVILGGCSFGGNIAVEMLNLLEEKSIHVQQIHLFDTIESAFYRDQNKIFSIGFIYQKLRDFKWSFLTNADIFKYQTGRKLNKIAPISFKFISKFVKLALEDEVLTRLAFKKNELKDFNFIKKNLKKMGKYPLDLDVKTPFISYQAEESKDYKAIHSLGWKYVVKNIQSFTIKGGHTTMLEEPFVHELAKVMNTCLNESSSLIVKTKFKEVLIPN